jgi:hypothetical protein
VSTGRLNLDPTAEQIVEQLRSCSSSANTFGSAAEAAEKVRAAIGWYVHQYRQAPYDSAKFMDVIHRILKGKFGLMMLGGDRQKLLGLGVQAVESCKDTKKLQGRPKQPREIMQVAAYLADLEHDENGKAFTLERERYEGKALVGVDQAYQSASDRLNADYGIVIKPETIKVFREQDNKAASQG